MNATTEQEREKRDWWIVLEGYAVEHLTGYTCAPNNPDMWWFPQPQAGFSTSKVFSVESNAVRAAIEALDSQLGVLEAQAIKLHTQWLRAKAKEVAP